MVVCKEVLSSIVFLFYYFQVSKTEKVIEENILHRSRRQLLFPNSTLLQLNAGVATPSPHEHINVNWAFQANFQLPWNRSQIPIDVLEAYPGYDGMSRGKRDENSLELDGNRDGDYESDAKLYHFYKFVEEVLTSFGYNGTSCVLQTLCQLGAEPLYTDDDEDLLHELASFVLNPTNDVEQEVTEKDEPYPYIQAYHRGELGKHCHNVYSDCKISLTDMFTILHHDSK